MPEQLKLDPYVVHATFQYAGTEGKRHRMREAMLFLDPPNIMIPQVDSYHLNWVFLEACSSLENIQLKLTSLWLTTKLDKFWCGHPGILPETLTKQLFVCPLDHVFEVNIMLSDLPEETYGPRIDFREYSFLKNPLLPSKVKESTLEVRVCDEKSSNCTRNKPGAIGFPKNGSNEKLVQVLSSFKDVKIIQFSSMDLNFPGFTDKAREEKFRKRVKKYTNGWCCLQKSPYKGHIYYDIYWDENPGWKPKPPEKEEDDHPPLK